MASGRRKQRCPICCEVPKEIAHALPCRHEFCLGCILRWQRGILTCPLCRRLISNISFSEKEGDCLKCIIRHPREASSHAGKAGGSRDGHSTRGLVASLASTSMGGILPELWAELFRRRQSLLNPVRSWLQQWLQKIYSERWWQVKTAESSILMALCIFGPDREVLLQRLQPCLQHYTAQLVHGVLSIIETQCSQEVRRLWGCHAAQEEAKSPRASSGPSTSPGDAPTSSGSPDSSVERQASVLEEAFKGNPSTRGTTPTELEQP